jgi:hypothetical protein
VRLGCVQGRTRSGERSRDVVEISGLAHHDYRNIARPPAAG